jgi:hypothetical protein
MRKLMLIALFSVSYFMSMGQLTEAEERRAEFLDQFHFALTLAPFYDVVVSPVYTTTTLEIDPTSSDPDAKIPVLSTYQSQAFSPFTIGVTMRYNLYEFDKETSVGFSIPFAFGLSSSNGASEYVNGRTGFGHVQVPFHLMLARGLGATYRSESDLGVLLSFGMEYNKVGLIGDRTAVDAANRGWFMPSAQVGITTWRGGAPVEYGLKYAFGPLETYNIDKDGQTMLQPITTRAYSLKFIISYHLNY